MAFKSRPLRLVPLSRLILAKLYEQHVNDNPKDRFSVEEVSELFSIPVSKNLIRSALERLHRESNYQNALVVRRGAIKKGDQGYAIGDFGISIVEKSLLQKSSDIAHYIANGDEVIEDIAGIDGHFFTSEEFADRDEWVPLEIDREAPEYIEAVEDLEKAIETIRGDNGFAAHYPLEREGILNSLSEGLDWLKSKCPTRAQIKTMLLGPLNWVSTTFPNAVVAETAKKAAQKLVDLLLSYF